MEFQSLERDEQVTTISEAKGFNIIFKHNTTCPISRSVIRKLETEASVLPGDTPVYILDLLKYRDVSNAVAERFDVVHESPQLLLIKDGKCLYHESLYEISADKAAEVIKNNA